ncbi:MAG: L,D-transpeptidase [Balneolaceae bacterium]|nr:L,D-transpeptidase [Balneolaceae bacterium]
MKTFSLILLFQATFMLLPSHFKAVSFSQDLKHEEIKFRSFENICHFEDTVKLGDYFNVIESIVSHYNRVLSYPVTEHHLIRNNPWVMDSLAATDYYQLKERGVISLDPKILPIFTPGQYLIIPDSITVDSLNRVFKQTYLDLNIPEFKLRVFQADSIIHEFPVRVGRNESRFLAMAGRVINLQTRTGNGKIVRHAKNPMFINPVNNQRYHVTRRDDGVVTSLPNIPWLETEINGIRHGQLIHPTTNIETLGKAYSNGCIGTSEAAGWYLYYYAPLDTRISIRYDLDIIEKEGNAVTLEDIYTR